MSYHIGNKPGDQYSTVLDKRGTQGWEDRFPNTTPKSHQVEMKSGRERVHPRDN